MRLKFKTNLGSKDAELVGVDFTKCQKGMELEVSDKAGEWLIKNGIAAEVAKQIRGVAPEPELAKEVQPTIKAMPPVGKAKPTSNKES